MSMAGKRVEVLMTLTMDQIKFANIIQNIYLSK